MRDILRLNRLRLEAEGPWKDLGDSPVAPSQRSDGAATAAEGVHAPPSLRATIHAIEATMHLVMDRPTPTDAVRVLVSWRRFEAGMAARSPSGGPVKDTKGAYNRAGDMLDGLGTALDLLLKNGDRCSTRHVPYPPPGTPQLSDPLVTAIPRAVRARGSTVG